MSDETAQSKIDQLDRENQRLRRAVEELSILNDVATAVNSTSTMDEIVDLVVQRCVKHLTVEQGAVLLFNQGDTGAPLRTMVRKVQSDGPATLPFRLSDQLAGWMLKNQSTLVVNDFSTDERFEADHSEHSLRSMISAPLRLKGRMLGVLAAFNKQHSDEGFTESDERLMMIIASQAAQVIENARLYEEEKALERIQQELKMAYRIQMTLLPAKAPQVEGFDLAGRTVPAQNVGGDYFDFLAESGGRLAVCLGDVSGKGMPAALLMANVQATIRGQHLLRPSAADCLQRSNRLLYESTSSEKFVTLFYAVLETDSGKLQYCNAGHNPPVVLRQGGEPVRLTTGGPVLGVLPEFQFDQDSVTLAPGDTLLIFSDGFSEAMNGRFEEFGEDRLIELARAHSGDTAVELIDRLSKVVNQHTGDAPQTDDMTMVVVRALR